MAKKQALSYEESKRELDEILHDLQGDELDVDAALAKYKRGLELAKQIENYLKDAQNEIRELKTKFDKNS